MKPTVHAANEQGHSSAPFAAVGRALRETRQSRGEDLYDIAEYLRIRPSYLFALEDGEFDATPGQTYALGFLRSYADYLGYDAHQIITQAKRSIESDEGGDQPTYRKRTVRKQRISLFQLGAAGLGALVVLGVWQFVDREHGAPFYRLIEFAGTIGRSASEFADSQEAAEFEQSARGLSKANQEGDVIRLETQQSSSSSGLNGLDVTVRSADLINTPELHLRSLQLESAEVPFPTFANYLPDVPRIILIARQNSWIQVKSKARDFVRTRTLDTGEKLSLPNRDDLALWTGNAGGVEVLLDGKSIGVLGDVGAVMEEVPLLPDHLRGIGR